MTKTKIPETDSIHKLVEFWDKHDLTDFQTELEEVKDVVFERQTSLKIQLSVGEAQAIKRIADTEGLDCARMVRDWIIEKVRSA